jgi:hypothetical protein
MRQIAARLVVQQPHRPVLPLPGKVPVGNGWRGRRAAILSICFFPTVHIHEGKIESSAHFDHSLYCQAEWQQNGWEISRDKPYDRNPISAKPLMSIAGTKGIVNSDTVIQKRRLHGLYPNKDVFLPSAVID